MFTSHHLTLDANDQINIAIVVNVTQRGCKRTNHAQIIKIMKRVSRVGRIFGRTRSSALNKIERSGWCSNIFKVQQLAGS